YLATVAQYAATNWGITFTSVEPFNEPIATWWKSTGTQEGCHFETGTQAAVIGYLRNELNNRNWGNMLVSASDESFYDQATSTWNSFGTTTKGQVGRVNVHGYQKGGGRRDLLYSAVAGKKLWNSEYGEDDGSGVQLASNLNLDFRWLHPTGWCYWQVFDSGGWGLIQSNPGDKWIGTANPKYYVLAHYTRHIRPGMKILDGGEGNTIAAYDAAAHKLVLVTMNYGTAQWISYDLSRFYNVAGPIRRWMTAAASSGVKYAQYSDTVLSGRSFRSYFATNTIQTFEVSNVYIDPSPPPVPAGLTATAGVGQVALSWTASSGATSYNLKRGTAPGGPYTSQGSVTATSFTDTAVTNETTYYYVLSAVSAGGESANSAEVNATPHAPPRLWVNLPTGGTQLTLSWAGGATSYTPYMASNLVAPVLWQPVTNPPQSSNGLFFLLLPAPNAGCQFFRLEAP
ncbi:MAG TPA: hypothetical protein VNZ22_03640, partial [Bacillota bacterium]|nr:hypothetical protein [Bacillota bacterium]